MSEVKIMWRVFGSYSHSPEKIEVIKQTAHFVTIKTKDFLGKETPRRIRMDDVYDTFKEAKDAIIEREERRISNYETKLIRAKRDLQLATELKEPE